MRIKKAIIPAAGLGSSFLPATKAQPKEMMPIIDKPTVQYIVEEAIEAGIEDIIIVTGRHKRSIEDHFDKNLELELALEKKGKYRLLEMIEEISNLIDVNYVRQREARGLGDAILATKTFIADEPFAVLLGDDLITSESTAIGELITAYDKKKSTIIGTQKVAPEMISQHGIVGYSQKEDGLARVKQLLEKPSLEEAPSDIAILGRYILTPQIFDILETLDCDDGEEIELTDALAVLMEDEPIYAKEFEGRRYNIGTKLGYLEATIDFALKRDDLKEDLRDYLNCLAEN